MEYLLAIAWIMCDRNVRNYINLCRYILFRDIYVVWPIRTLETISNLGTLHVIVPQIPMFVYEPRNFTLQTRCKMML
jgi:hypothetical protein